MLVVGCLVRFVFVGIGLRCGLFAVCDGGLLIVLLLTVSLVVGFLLILFVLLWL